MPFVILPTNSASGGYNITNSLRFNSGSSDYLSRTMSSTGSSRTTFTFSTWIKLSSLTSAQALFTSGDSSSFFRVYVGSTSRIGIEDYYSVTDTYNINWATPSAGILLRDPSAWYHLVVAIDTTQATASNRVKIYLNGSDITSNFTASNSPSQNAQLQINNNNTMYFGYGVYQTLYFSGYQSEVYFINGQQLTPSSFGETDEDTGIWKPKAYTGTYGTNGFYLQFKNSSSLGTDSSGNGNTFTVNNLTSIDQTTDTPTNNFATLISNFGVRATTETYSEGNLKVVGSGNAFEFSPSSIAPSAGKWYFEAKMESKTNYPTIGFQETSQARTNNFWMVSTSQGYGLHHDGTLYRNNASEGSLTGYTTGDIMAVALDLDNGKAYFRKNGTWLGSADPANGTNPAFSSIPAGTYYLGVSNYNSTWGANFGNPYYSANSYTDSAGFGNFSYSVPSGYFALCTANLSLYG